jgi:UDP-2,3-diacylglucosamine hydrolase
MTQAYFVSDLHLESMTDPKALVFLDWLHSLELASSSKSKAHEIPTHLFLVGDVFDLWVADHVYFVERFKPIVEGLHKLVALGVEVHYFEGNHDLHLEKFWRTEVGVQVHARDCDFELAGQVVRVEHGDLMNPNDQGYLFLRWFLRTPLLRFLAFHLPAAIVGLIGERASRASRAYTSTSPSKVRSAANIREMVRRHAAAVFQDRRFDLLISGHVHVSDDFTFEANGKKIRSVNLGSWYESPHVFLLSEAGACFLELGPATSV